MPSYALTFLIAISCGLIAGLVARLVARRRLERRAWGARGPALSRADRREIRRAIHDGRPVGDRALASSAVRYGEEVESSIARAASLRRDPPHRLYVAGRILFPLLGVIALVLGVVDHDASTVVSGIVLLAFTVLYLPVTERRARARMTRRDHRLRDSLDANRILSANP